MLKKSCIFVASDHSYLMSHKNYKQILGRHRDVSSLVFSWLATNGLTVTCPFFYLITFYYVRPKSEWQYPARRIYLR